MHQSSLFWAFFAILVVTVVIVLLTVNRQINIDICIVSSSANNALKLMTLIVLIFCFVCAWVKKYRFRVRMLCE